MCSRRIFPSILTYLSSCHAFIQLPVSSGSSSCQVFQSKDIPEKSTTPEEFIRMTKGITIATAKAVAAGNSAQQEDVIATANLSRKAISDMLSTCKVLIPPPTWPEQAPGCQETREPREDVRVYGCSCWQ